MPDLNLNQTIYMPSSWYWRADDGRIFSAPAEALVADTDPDFVAFSAVATPHAWPRDAADQQTDEALQALLLPHNKFVSLATYTADVRWRKEQGGITLSSGMPIKTDDRAQAKINGTRIVAQGNASLTTQWHAADGTYYPMTSAQLLTMSDELQTHINNCFDISSQTLAGIADGSITTRQQIDAAFNAPMTQARKDWLKPH